MVGYRRRSPDTIASLIAGLSCVAALLCCYEAGSWLAAGPSGGSRALLSVADYGAPPDISYSSAQKVRLTSSVRRPGEGWAKAAEGLRSGTNALNAAASCARLSTCTSAARTPTFGTPVWARSCS